MDDKVTAPPRRTVSVPNLIGWLSLCLLAAAWGRTLDARWQTVWAYAGAAGLAAAVGLKSLEKARYFRENWLRENANRLRFEGRLAHLIDQSATLGPINDALVELARHTDERRQGASWQPARTKDQRGFGYLPVEIIPVEENGTFYERGCDRNLSGRLRNISASAVSFEHKLPFDERVVLLLFELGENRQLYLAVDIRWTKPIESGYVSGGAVMDAGDSVPQGFNAISEQTTVS